jgi:hypothetical protein
MIIFKKAIVRRIINTADGVTEVEIDIEGAPAKAVNYDEMTGPVAVGDEAVVNTTAGALSLGSGGFHFVLWNLSANGPVGAGPGHLMKLRYTPLQHAGLSVEEEKSPHHQVLRDCVDIAGQPVVACGLHSQLLPVAATIKALDPDVTVAYVMTDGGALPAKFSRTVRWLKQEGFLSTVITAGQAFGGDLEAVNIYSALAAARWAVKADITITAMGPGIAGTGTALGHTGLEPGQVVNAVCSLGGQPIVPLRLSQRDERRRHYGVSHHSITALTTAALGRALVPIPELSGQPADFARLLHEQLDRAGIAQRHRLRSINNTVTLSALNEIELAGGPKASTMGRGAAEEPAFFLAAGAAGIAALELRDETNEGTTEIDRR